MTAVLRAAGRGGPPFSAVRLGGDQCGDIGLGADDGAAAVGAAGVDRDPHPSGGGDSDRRAAEAVGDADLLQNAGGRHRVAVPAEGDPPLR